jgi:nicotinamidase-related amidase
MNILVLVDMQNDFINGSLGVGHEKWDEAFGKLKVAYDRLNPDMIVDEAGLGNGSKIYLMSTNEDIILEKIL